MCRRAVEFLGEHFRIVALAGEAAGVCDFQNGIFRGVQEVAADLQTVPVEEIYGGLLHIFLEKLAAFASGYAPRRGASGEAEGTRKQRRDVFPRRGDRSLFLTD